MASDDAPRGPPAVSDTPATLDGTLGDDGSPGRGRGPERELARGELIGRYVVLERIGAGGMGVVHAVYDPELDRRLAVKLLRDETDDPVRRVRLWREAQAMARLNHPNVCVVHDVGTHDGQVYIAMEFVEGETLGRWRTRQPRSVPEVVRCLVEAGRGLSAAHAAGLVHRDFKPDNVVVGAERVRVMDFGLARPVGGTEGSRERPPGISESGASADALAGPLTREGSVAGTPAYMAPEQHFGFEVTAAADQFSFCVTLYEALYDERPFAGKTLQQLAVALTQGEVQPAPSGRRVSASLRRVIVRGLDPDPDRRWPSMDTLLEALQAEVEVRGSRRVLAVGALTLVVAGIGTGYWVRDEPPCAAVAADGDAIWNDARREQIRSAFAATALPYADGAAQRVERELDRYLARWSEARVAACEATHVRGEQSDALLDRRMACLHRRLDEAGALVAVLVQPDPAVVEHAPLAVGQLRSLHRCGDADALMAAVPPPEDPIDAERVRRVRGRLDGAKALRDAGRVDEGLRAVREAMPEVDAVAYAPLHAEARLELGAALEAAGEYREAERAWQDALYRGLAARHDDVATEAAIALVGVVGSVLSDPAQGERWARQAAAMVDRTAAGPPVRARLLGHRGGMLENAARFAEARDAYGEALDVLRRSEEATPAQVAEALTNYGSAARALGDFDAAQRLHEEALGAAEAALGPRHPHLSRYLNLLGIVLDDLGRFAEAVEVYARALAVAEPALGASHPSIAHLRSNLGVALVNLERYDEALAEHRRALVAYEESVGAEHRYVAAAHNNIAVALMRMERHVEARQSLLRARSVWTAVHGPNHPDVADALVNEGSLLSELGEVDASRDLLRQAVAIYEGAGGADHPKLGKPLRLLGHLEAHQGHSRDAVAYLQRAFEIEANGNRYEAAITQFQLARQLLAVGNPQGARLHAEQARDRWAAEEGAESEVAEIEAWLGEHFGTG